MITHSAAQKDEFDRIVGHVESMMEELLKDNFFQHTAPDAWQPAMNVYETPQQYIACLELAGMDREKIDVQAAQGFLYVRGQRAKPMPRGVSDQDVSVHVMEIDSGRFQRKVPVPNDVDTGAVEARYRNGYLWIVMPRLGNKD
ncbi:MAG: Hsp20/alpha crystallin family protein [Phycisphaerae bacterium]